ncbi:hypothetical protein DV515_00014081 [Chloebia gouldiae]|uniref:Uncharacterized protein n=1 Tax=Chloebia gouldiae TaxID=44316 RepID=A0A3L8S0A5_CHLGU|nr:hypothetical protein DV515_00014081 [Chloebia gouldiae]
MPFAEPWQPELMLQVLCGIDGSAQQLQLGMAVDAEIKPIKALNNTMVGWTVSISRGLQEPKKELKSVLRLQPWEVPQETRENGINLLQVFQPTPGKTWNIHEECGVSHRELR